MNRRANTTPDVLIEAVAGSPVTIMTVPGAAIDANRISHPSIRNLPFMFMA
jgi:hypothetical protein